MILMQMGWDGMGRAVRLQAVMRMISEMVPVNCESICCMYTQHLNHKATGLL